MEKSKLVEYGLVVAGVALVAVLAVRGCKGPTVTVTQPLPNTTVVTTTEPTVTIKTVEKVVTDPAQVALIKALLAENSALKVKVTSLTNTVATLNTSGGKGIDGGNIVQVEPDPKREPNQVQGTPSQAFKFTDYQLAAAYNSDGSAFTYTLSQEFLVQTTSGYRKDGTKLGLVELYRKGPKQTLVPIASKTTEIFADERAPHWIVSPSIEGGLGLSTEGKEAVVGVQWLKRGKSPAAEDSSLALLTPAWSTKQGLTLLPVSVNIGSIKHVPFKDIWLSPTVGLNKSLGGAITATF